MADSTAPDIVPAPDWARALLRGFLRLLFRLVYRVEVKGLDQYPLDADRVIVIANHSSLLDAPLLYAFLPGKPTFAIDSSIAAHWWVKPWLRFIEAFRITPSSPYATKTIIKAVKDGRHAVIFPEGRITVTGSLMKVYDGTGMVADKTGAKIVPVRIDGAQHSRFSYTGGILPRRWFPKIRLSVLAPVALEIPESVVGRARRQEAGRRLSDLLSDLVFETARRPANLFLGLLKAGKLHGMGRGVLQDAEMQPPLSYRRLAAGAHALGAVLAAETAPGERVGVMLPNVNGVVVTLFALIAKGRVPAILNYTAGASNILSTCRTATVKTVLTSRRFIEKAKLESVIAGLGNEVRIVYLDDLREKIGSGDRIAALLRSFLPAALQAPDAGSGDDPAVILFTSGSEGAPKGVVLSHDNILSNLDQIRARVPFNPTDSLFNALPVFHSFGLVGGTLLPLLSGLKVTMYPSPLHYRIVPEMVYYSGATIMFGTDTFLSGYARVANPYDFFSMRMICAGAEKLRDETRRIWSERFGVRVLEGYGTTEMSPVVALNTPLYNKPGSIGRLLPGIDYRLEPVPGIEDGARLHLSGPNLMRGYLKADAPGRLQPPEDGWYDTGDIVTVDKDGFFTLVGRAKRFAKIAGEMVSLAAVEALAARAWPEAHHAVVALPDPKKGERLVLLTTAPLPERAALAAAGQAAGATELMLPRMIIPLDALPMLATGKTDYVKAGKLAAEKAEAA